MESCSRDPIGYEDGLSLYGAYFGLAGLDPMGMETIVGVGDQPIFQDGNVCYWYNASGVPVTVSCPNVPDFNEVPSYPKGLSTIWAALGDLQAGCSGCAKTCGCSEDDCKNSMHDLVIALMQSWRDHFGQGVFPAEPEVRPPGVDLTDPVGGYMCYEWALFFENAAANLNSDCFSMKRQVSVKWPKGTGRPRGGNPRNLPPREKPYDLKVHWHLEIQICKDTKKVISFDDGFYDGGCSHCGPFPPSGGSYQCEDPKLFPPTIQPGVPQPRK